MKVPFIKRGDLELLKVGTKTQYKNYQKDDNSWIAEVLGRNPFMETKFECPDIILKMDKTEPFETEFENVRMVYENLKFLSDSQASDERLWAGLSLGPFWKYVQYRWHFKEGCTAENVKQHYYFGYGPRRSLTRNAAARLWWVGRLTYDKDLDDHYELTRFVCENSNYVMSILERNTSNNAHITRPFVRALLDARKEGYVIDTSAVKAMTKYLNILGGVYILDSLPESIIFNKTMEEIQRTIKRQ